MGDFFENLLRNHIFSAVSQCVTTLQDWQQRKILFDFLYIMQFLYAEFFVLREFFSTFFCLFFLVHFEKKIILILSSIFTFLLQISLLFENFRSTTPARNLPLMFWLSFLKFNFQIKKWNCWNVENSSVKLNNGLLNYYCDFKFRGYFG